jgi:hypothetical protein
LGENESQAQPNRAQLFKGRNSFVGRRIVVSACCSRKHMGYRRKPSFFQGDDGLHRDMLFKAEAYQQR